MGPYVFLSGRNILFQFCTGAVDDVPDVVHRLTFKGHHFSDRLVSLLLKLLPLRLVGLELFKLLHGSPLHEDRIFRLLFPGLLSQYAEDETDAEAKADEQRHQAAGFEAT